MAKGDVSGEVKERVRGREYSIRVRLAPDDTHKGWHWSPWKKVKGNKAKANAELVAYAKELADDAFGLNVTVAEYVDRWQEAREQLGKVSPLTLERDKPEINRIKSYLGTVQLRDLTADQIEVAYVEAAKKEGLSQSGIHKFHSKLRQILKKAYSDKIIDRNPCDAIDGITRPKVSPEKKKIKRITEAEAQRFARELREEPKSGKTVAVWLALSTGMRRGEVLALAWSAIDLDNRRLSIRKQYGKEHRAKDTKTPKSKRTIALDPVTVDVLKEWREQQAFELGLRGVPVNGETPVCTSRSGGFLEPDTFNRWRRSFYVEHGIGYFEDPDNKRGYIGPDFHALRHAQATMLIAEGVDPKTVQERLGHERVSATLEIYAEAEIDKDAEAAEKIGMLLGA